ncbi:cysteine desulfurase family protein [Salirhabdus sp. Marseille-P4669]|uniref:cysteine desulfurase family protein n=1 Tax=Salirhabdus sp. Marseille-P4669 TaxID=2042310 RepID=UPI000C7DC321|nr:cysteine desulfurase family protein [Salirhabdus sp. Marseille-P4669]
MNPIYLDHAATTPVHPEVVQAMLPILENVYGNPSSIHYFGRQARKILDEARRTIASSINAQDKEIIFTAGGTEADNLAILGVAKKYKHKGKHIITTSIEHHATLHTAEYLEKEGFEVTYLPVNENGQISIDDLEANLRDDTILVSIMYVNNETGVIQPIQEIGFILENHQALFHTDAVQAYGVLPIDVQLLGVDLLSASAHKIYGPKGIGFLYAKEGIMLEAMQHGGEQERKRRAGTENTSAIAGFQKAVELVMEERKKRMETYVVYRKLFLDTLSDQGIQYEINGNPAISIPSTINLSFPGTNVESLLTNFDLAGVAASSGSACTAGSVDPSHVLSAMYGSDNERTKNSIRFSFGIANNEENIKEAALKVASIVKRLTN